MDTLCTFSSEIPFNRRVARRRQVTLIMISHSIGLFCSNLAECTSPCELSSSVTTCSFYLLYIPFLPAKPKWGRHIFKLVSYGVCMYGMQWEPLLFWCQDSLRLVMNSEYAVVDPACFPTWSGWKASWEWVLSGECFGNSLMCVLMHWFCCNLAALSVSCLLKLFSHIISSELLDNPLMFNYSASLVVQTTSFK